MTWVDPEGYLWIEEYPGSLDYTLNGKMYATFGLYEYALATQDRTVWSAERHAGAVRLLKGSLTTLKTFASKYRNPGGPSAYCLKHRPAQPEISPDPHLAAPPAAPDHRRC